MDLEKAKSLLTKEGYTCVLVRDQQIFTSRERGVKPLLDWLDAACVAPGFSAADKVVGKATAFLYCLLGVKAVYADVMSLAALEVLQQHGIEASCRQQVDYIRNRQNTGMCPMEAATQSALTPEQAREAVLAVLNKLRA